MTTHRRFTYTTNLSPERKQAASDVLEAACERCWWFTEAVVEGDPLTISLVVAARDQWFARRRANLLAVDVAYAAGSDEKAIQAVRWQKLPPHTNRGFLLA